MEEFLIVIGCLVAGALIFYGGIFILIWLFIRSLIKLFGGKP